MTVRTRVERAAARAFLRLPAPLLRALTGAQRRSPEGFALDPEIQALTWLMELRNGEDMHARGAARPRGGRWITTGRCSRGPRPT